MATRRGGATGLGVALGAAWTLGACGQWAPLEYGAPGSDRGALLAAVQARVGTPEQGTVRVERAWGWRPLADRPMVVWAACRGSGDGRVCAVAIGEFHAGAVRVLALEPVGWSVPQLGERGSRDEIMIAGQDGRGDWRQPVRFTRDQGGTIVVGRRLYDDGI